MSILIVGPIAVFASALLGGLTGFGYSVLCTPLLLLAGMPLPAVVATNLVIAMVTRVTVVWRLRADIDLRNALQLVMASLPGAALGIPAHLWLGTNALKFMAGAVSVIAVVVLTTRRGPSSGRIPGGRSAAGFLGGFFGSTTSLNGVPPALLLRQERVAPRPFIGEISFYLVGSNVLILVVLLASGNTSVSTINPWIALWLPLGIAGNIFGVRLADRIRYETFQYITSGIVLISGLVTMGMAALG